MSDSYDDYEAKMQLVEQPVQEPVGDEWTPCMKLPVVVHVRQQRHGESHVSTREGITPVKPDDLIMRGVSGEEYPIGRAIFEQTYSLDIAPSLPVQEQQQVGPVEDMLLRRAVLRSAKIVSDGRFVTKQAALEQPPLPVQPEPLEYWNAVEGWVKIESQGELK